MKLSEIRIGATYRGCAEGQATDRRVTEIVDETGEGMFDVYWKSPDESRAGGLSLDAFASWAREEVL